MQSSRGSWMYGAPTFSPLKSFIDFESGIEQWALYHNSFSGIAVHETWHGTSICRRRESYIRARGQTNVTASFLVKRKPVTILPHSRMSMPSSTMLPYNKQKCKQLLSHPTKWNHPRDDLNRATTQCRHS